MNRDLGTLPHMYKTKIMHSYTVIKTFVNQLIYKMLELNATLHITSCRPHTFHLHTVSHNHHWRRQQSAAEAFGEFKSLAIVNFWDLQLCSQYPSKSNVSPSLPASDDNASSAYKFHKSMLHYNNYFLHYTSTKCLHSSATTSFAHKVWTLGELSSHWAISF